MIKYISFKYISFDSMVELRLQSCRLNVWPSEYIQDLCVTLHTSSLLTRGLDHDQLSVIFLQ